MALSDDQKTQLADLYDEAKQSGDKVTMQRIYSALQDDARPMSPVSPHPMQTYIEGIGQQFHRLGLGLQQMSLGSNPVNPETGDELDVSKERAQNQSAIAEDARLGKPLADSTPGKLGNMTTDAALMAAVPGGWMGAMAGGGALAGAQPVQEGQSRAINTGLGVVAGAAGQGAGAVVGRIIRPVGNYLVGARDQAVSVLKAAGVPLDAAQQTGSKVLITAKNAASDSPLLGPSTMPAEQASAYTGAVLRSMGVNGAEDASPAVMQQGRQALKSAYDAVASRNQINVDPVMDRALYTLQHQAETSLTEADAKVIKAQLKNISDGIRTGADPGTGLIDGERYANIMQALDRVPGDGGKAPFVRDIRQILTGALRRSASPEDVQLLAQTDARYAAMKQIEKAIGPDNQINPHLLYNAVDSGGRGVNQSVYGGGPNQQLVQLAQAGKLVFGARTPNSGTAQRAAGMALFGAASGIADAKAHGGSVETPLATLAGALGGPALMRSVIENPTTANAIGAWARNQGIHTASDVARWIASRAATGAAASQAPQAQQ